MSDDLYVWFDTFHNAYYHLADQAELDGLTDDEIDNINIFEKYVEEKFDATLIRDSADDEEFWQWIGIKFKNEQDMIMFILRASNV